MVALLPAFSFVPVEIGRIGLGFGGGGGGGGQWWYGR